MPPKNNVIDFVRRRQEKQSKPTKAKKSPSPPLTKKAAVEESVEDSPLLDMTERRQEILQQERRQVRRTILTEFIGAFAVIPSAGLTKVALYDISDNGIAFDTAVECGQFKPGEEVAMRVYLNQQTYFPFIVKIQNVRAESEEGVYRHGANFLKDTINEKALHHFVKFIETVSASLQKDTGDVMVSNLGR